MKASHNNAAGRVGYVRAVFSERARGFAAPLDLLRVVCRVAGRVATRQRIGDAFKGYLVSESGQVAPMFAKSRGRHSERVDSLSVTGGGFSWAVGLGDAIDAPDVMAAGGMWRFDPEPFDYPCPSPLYAGRGVGEVDRCVSGAGELVCFSDEPFSAGRHWHKYSSPWVTGCDVSARSVWAVWVGDDDKAAIDAPDVMAAGSSRLLTVLDSGRRLSRQSVVDRGAE